MAPFRFFDLPAELRLKVYEELLTIQRSKSTTTQISRRSQILRASKTCYNEAQPILERLNAVEIHISAFALRDGLPGDHALPNVVLRFAGGLQRTLWHAFENLPMSAGSCYDVHQRWQHALQSGGGGGMLRVTLQMAYHSITCNGAERLAAAIMELELERQGVADDGVCDMVFETFETTTKSLAGGCMSIAEVFQLTYALEHMKDLTEARFPQLFVSGRSGDYDSMMNRNHAHELMTASTKPEAQFIQRLWTLMEEWLPASVANVTTKILLGRHPCRSNFRRDIRLLEKHMSHFKGPARPQRSLKLPYTQPPVVWGLLPWVESFFARARMQHTQEGTSTVAGKS